MSAAYRRVEIAAGQAHRLRLSPNTAARPGRVLLVNNRNRTFEVDLARWEQGVRL